MNSRPPGYEPDELPTALLRYIKQSHRGVGDRTRTGTVFLPEDFKSSVSTIPPHRHSFFILAHITKKVKMFVYESQGNSI